MLQTENVILSNRPEVSNVSKQKSVSAIPATVMTLIQNSKVLIQHREFSLAINLLRQASNIQSHPIIFRELTLNLIQLEKWSEANRTCAQWCRSELNFDSVYFRAQIEYQLGLDEKSLQSYFECLSIVDEERIELFEVFKNIGNLFVRKADFESAEEFYNKAYALKSDSDILLVNYGILEMQRGDLNKARDRFRSAVQLNDRNDKAWVGLSMVHFDFGDEELGTANLKKALDLNVQNRTAIQFALQKLNQRQHSTYLSEILSQYLSEVDFDDEISCQLIQKFYESGKIELAYLEAQRLILWNPERTDYQKLFSHLEHQKNNPNQVSA
jgi:tetratricopeptide (TPR) repeat protein